MNFVNCDSDLVYKSIKIFFFILFQNSFVLQMIHNDSMFICLYYKYENTFFDNSRKFWTNIFQAKHITPQIDVFWAIHSIFSKCRVPVVLMKNVVSIYVLWYLNYLLIAYWAYKVIWKCISCSLKASLCKNRKIHGCQKNPYFVPLVCIKNFKIFVRQLLDMYICGVWIFLSYL